MMSLEEQAKLEHDELTRLYYRDKAISKAEFERRHAEIWAKLPPPAPPELPVSRSDIAALQERIAALEGAGAEYGAEDNPSLWQRIKSKLPWVK